MRFFFTTLAVLSLNLAVPAMAQTIATTAKQAIVVDYETGTVLFEKNADERMPTSSMSKVMTMYMVFEALKEGRLKLDGELTVSEKAWRMQGSKTFVDLGTSVKVEDLVRGVVVQSGNDATIVLAEGLGGTEENFAQKMTEKARALGMKDSNFVNASGWPDDNHYSTARDLATLGIAVVRDFPDYYKYYAEKEFIHHNIRQGNRNPLLYQNIGADGIKTGHTEAAGYGLIGSGVRDGRRVVLVVNGMMDEKQRAEESARILDWGLREFENKTLFRAGKPVEQAEVIMGEADVVPLVLESDVMMTIPRGKWREAKVEVAYEGPITAPVKKGQAIGKLTLSIPGLPTVEKPVLAANDVPRLGFFPGAMEKAKLFLLGRVTDIQSQ